MVYLQLIRSVVCAIKSRMDPWRGLFGGCLGFIQGTWVGFWGVVGFWGWLSQRCDKNAQCSGRSSKSDAKVQKIFDICKFRGMKKYEKYIKVVERNGKDEKRKLGGVAPRVRPAGHERRREEDQEGMGDGEKKTRRAWGKMEKLVSFCLNF